MKLQAELRVPGPSQEETRCQIADAGNKIFPGTVAVFPHHSQPVAWSSEGGLDETGGPGLEMNVVGDGCCQKEPTQDPHSPYHPGVL